MSTVDKLRPNDDRVTYKDTTLNGRRYRTCRALLAVPVGHVWLWTNEQEQTTYFLSQKMAA